MSDTSPEVDRASTAATAINSTIYIGKPQLDPFPLSQNDFDAALAERFPDVTISHRTNRRGREYTLFSVTLDELVCTGDYSSSGNLILNDANGQVWASTIVWFLGLIPGYQAEMMIEVAHPDSAPIPDGATASDVAAVYESLAARAQ